MQVCLYETMRFFVLCCNDATGQSWPIFDTACCFQMLVMVECSAVKKHCNQMCMCVHVGSCCDSVHSPPMVGEPSRSYESADWQILNKVFIWDCMFEYMKVCLYRVSVNRYYACLSYQNVYASLNQGTVEICVYVHLCQKKKILCMVPYE